MTRSIAHRYRTSWRGEEAGRIREDQGGAGRRRKMQEGTGQNRKEQECSGRKEQTLGGRSRKKLNLIFLPCTVADGDRQSAGREGFPA